MTKHVKTIAAITRARRLSANGNPRFEVRFTDGTAAKTETDAAINYGIENPEYRDVPVEFEFNEHGNIVQATPVTEPK